MLSVNRIMLISFCLLALHVPIIRIELSMFTS